MRWEEALENININYYMEIIEKAEGKDIEAVLKKSYFNIEDFTVLISNVANNYLEEIAQKAQIINTNSFGKSVLLYTPMYISNFCINKCTYCGFNQDVNISRRKLTYEEIEKEAQEISKTGLKHILVLAGESKKHTPMDYLVKTVEILKNSFDSIGIEIMPLEKNEIGRASCRERVLVVV